MKLNKIAVGVALAAGAMAAHAADTVMFPYVVNSAQTTTIVSVVDTGNAATQRYNASGVVGAFGAGGTRLHWRLNYKSGANATNNAALCEELDFYLPTSPNDIQTVDLGGTFGAATSGVLFSDPSINNNWQAQLGALTYAIAGAVGEQLRGTLFVHNADNVVGQTVQGDAMVYEFATGAAWGYNGLVVDNGAADDANGFLYNNAFAAVANAAVPFMPMAEVTTRLFVTPLADTAAGTGQLNNGAAGSSPQTILAAGGANIGGWDRLTARVGLVTGAGVAFDRDENLISGSSPTNVTCVGAVDVGNLMTVGARAQLANGGFGLLNVAQPGGAAGIATTPNANVIKLEFAPAGSTFNGSATNGSFNNGFRL